MTASAAPNRFGKKSARPPKERENQQGDAPAVQWGEVAWDLDDGRTFRAIDIGLDAPVSFEGLREIVEQADADLEERRREADPRKR